MSSLVDDAARVLREASATRVPCPPLRSTFPGLDIALAYQVQRLNVQQALGTTGRIVGRKIGLTSRAVQTQLGVSTPDFGTLTDEMEQRGANGEQVL